MANIISIGTGLPDYCHKQSDILSFMVNAYNLSNDDKRKLGFLYRHSEIENRYSVIEDFSLQQDNWNFINSDKKERSINERLDLYDKYALPISLKAIKNCIEGVLHAKEITHLVTVSCTGMSAPGLDLQIAEALDLPTQIDRTSVNFMGCYAAIHALKMAKMICDTRERANVLIVCTEICTIHFQQEFSTDNAASSLLFGDGSAAVLISNSIPSQHKIPLNNFYSEVSYRGKNDMSWKISDHGFLMKLSNYIPDLIQEDIEGFVQRSLADSNLSKSDITHWCLHPGGKKILEVIQSQLHLTDEDLSCSKEVLWNYGNMSSPTILFVLKAIMESNADTRKKIFGVAFGPGLTMESFIAG